jgi:aspartyl-tRNA(Asn)/glutamyl-tRNA(Gln) amidotransferase subunit C
MLASGLVAPLSRRVDRALVLHVAKLASLSLSDEEADRFAGELARIVEFVEQLELVDTAGVEPTAHVLLRETPLREDELRACLAPQDFFPQAPHVEAGGFAVPTFVE